MRGLSLLQRLHILNNRGIRRLVELEGARVRPSLHRQQAQVYHFSANGRTSTSARARANYGSGFNRQTGMHKENTKNAHHESSSSVAAVRG